MARSTHTLYVMLEAKMALQFAACCVADIFFYFLETARERITFLVWESQSAGVDGRKKVLEEDGYMEREAMIFRVSKYSTNLEQCCSLLRR